MTTYILTGNNHCMIIVNVAEYNTPDNVGGPLAVLLQYLDEGWVCIRADVAANKLVYILKK